MKRRLLWLFVLCCALLLLMSLMVVGEEKAPPPPCERAGLLIPVTLQPVPPPEPEGQVADMAEAAEAAGVPMAAQPQRTAVWPKLLAYRHTAYYAFHPSDEAG